MPAVYRCAVALMVPTGVADRLGTHDSAVYVDVIERLQAAETNNAEELGLVNARQGTSKQQPMPQVPKGCPYWVYVGSRDPRGNDTGEVTIRIMPFHYQRRVAAIRPLFFASTRSFSSVAMGRKQAESLFGPLDWREILAPGKGPPPREPVRTGDYRALIVIRALNP